ncbi:hypothetical protein F4808DRAFT_345679 [Astrocystis sublimbata]|nr:hypothetical protein F4808DRAFT_345679 [Astrocystis sublimbata]
MGRVARLGLACLIAPTAEMLFAEMDDVQIHFHKIQYTMAGNDECAAIVMDGQRRHTRTRRGCERCRKQRRKCDEEKPRCRRCVNAGADASCKYVLHLSFKDKNSRTLPDGARPKSLRPSVYPNEYPTIKFIADESSGGTEPPEVAATSSESKPEQRSYKASQSLLVCPVEPSTLSITELELMKHYIHRVAPWLDVYDQNETFGHIVPKMAMNSPCVLEVLLQLTAVFSHRPPESVTRRGAGMIHLKAMSNPPESPASALQMMACFVLARALLFVDSIPATWERNFHGSGAFFYFNKFEFIETAQQQMWAAFVTLILRLEIAYHLMNEMAPLSSRELPSQLQALRGIAAADSNSQEILSASLQCLGLLTDIISFIFPIPQMDNEVGKLASARAVQQDAWKGHFDRLQKWHTSRPSDLEPLVESENTEDPFPIVIFTNGAGISSNIVYHVAMFILLSNKPQLDYVGDNDVPQMLPEWHAYRICGIAFHSEPECTNCWDPVTIAAFALAARRMKHHLLQRDVLGILDRLKAVGWHIDGLVDRIRSEWRLTSQ